MCFLCMFGTSPASLHVESVTQNSTKVIKLLIATLNPTSTNSGRLFAQHLVHLVSRISRDLWNSRRVAGNWTEHTSCLPGDGVTGHCCTRVAAAVGPAGGLCRSTGAAAAAAAGGRRHHVVSAPPTWAAARADPGPESPGTPPNSWPADDTLGRRCGARHWERRRGAYGERRSGSGPGGRRQRRAPARALTRPPTPVGSGRAPSRCPEWCRHRARHGSYVPSPLRRRRRRQADIEQWESPESQVLIPGKQQRLRRLAKFMVKCPFRVYQFH